MSDWTPSEPIGSVTRCEVDERGLVFEFEWAEAVPDSIRAAVLAWGAFSPATA